MGGLFAFLQELIDSTRPVAKRSVTHANDGQIGPSPGGVIPDPILADFQLEGDILGGQLSSLV